MQRIRKGACLALGVLIFIPGPVANALDDEEIDGMIEPEEGDRVPTKDLGDHMCTLEGKKVVRIDETLAAGLFGWIGSLVKVIGEALNEGREVELVEC